MASNIREIEHGSGDYTATIELRRRVLRAPLGLDFDPQDLAAEVGDFHMAAFIEGRLVGCLVLTPHGSALKMRQVAVEPGLQRGGVGTLLVESSEALARREGFVEIVLHARETAVPFYLRLGYELVGEPFEEVTLPHRAMRKRV